MTRIFSTPIRKTLSERFAVGVSGLAMIAGAYVIGVSPRQADKVRGAIAVVQGQSIAKTVEEQSPTFAPALNPFVNEPTLPQLPSSEFLPTPPSAQITHWVDQFEARFDYPDLGPTRSHTEQTDDSLYSLMNMSLGIFRAPDDRELLQLAIRSDGPKANGPNSSSIPYPIDSGLDNIGRLR